MTDGDIPQAMRLANLLEQTAGSSFVYRDKAAAELRRLYKEHAALEAEYKRLQELVTSQGIRLMEYESEQEPVAWMQEMPTKGDETRSVRLTTVEALAREEWANPIPLYTTPPRREWVGLMATEVHETEGYEEDRKLYRFARAIEAKLKEKNA